MIGKSQPNPAAQNAAMTMTALSDSRKRRGQQSEIRSFTGGSSIKAAYHAYQRAHYDAVATKTAAESGGNYRGDVRSNAAKGRRGRPKKRRQMVSQIAVSRYSISLGSERFGCDH